MNSTLPFFHNFLSASLMASRTNFPLEMSIAPAKTGHPIRFDREKVGFASGEGDFPLKDSLIE